MIQERKRDSKGQRIVIIGNGIAGNSAVLAIRKFDKDVDVVLDDRSERPGIKFKDCDLIGIPLRVTVGERNLKDGYVEIKMRSEKDSQRIRKEDVVERVMNHVDEFKRR